MSRNNTTSLIGYFKSMWIDFFYKVVHTFKILKKILRVDYLICLVYHLVVTHAENLSAEGILTSKRV